MDTYLIDSFAEILPILQHDVPPIVSFYTYKKYVSYDTCSVSCFYYALYNHVPMNFCQTSRDPSNEPSDTKGGS